MPYIGKIAVGGETYDITIPSGLPEEVQSQIRANIGAISAEETDIKVDGTYPQMTVGYATNAEKARNAENATKSTDAQNDGSGNNIEETYLKKSEAFLALHPVGGDPCIRFDDISPAELYGGTWEKIGAGRTLIQADSDEAPIYVPTVDTIFLANKNYYTLSDGIYTLATVTVGESVAVDTYYNRLSLGSEGGESDHKITVKELAEHYHDVAQLNEDPSAPLYTSYQAIATQWIENKDSKHLWDAYTKPVGNSHPHNNMSPYLAVNIWKRIA